MELVPPNIALSFEASFLPGLNVGMTVYNDSGASPVLVQGPTAMLNVVGGMYRGKFTGSLGQSYLIFTAVYTDDTLETLDTGYYSGSESVLASYVASSSSIPSQGCSIVGFVCEECEPGCKWPVFSIFQGDAKTLSLKIMYADSYDPVDLTNCTQIVVNLLNEDGTVTALELTNNQISITSPPVLGKFQAPISSEVSALLNLGEFQNIYVTFTIGSQVFTVPYLKQFSVFEV
jgi:hypothetical protein